MTQKIEKLLQELENNIEFCKTQNLNVSVSNVGWHIDHCLLTFDGIIKRLSQTNSKDYKWKPSFPRWFVLTTGKIPRGRAQAPERVRPKGDIDQVSLSDHLNLTKERIKELSAIDPRQFFEHPYFGHLN